MSGRVRIGTCANPADAAFIRSMFGARGISVVIAAEHHASLLGAIGSSFLSLDIWVAEADAEEASALLRDLREGDASGASGDDLAPAIGIDLAGAVYDDGDDDDGDDVQARTMYRRRTGLALLLACCITFGTAHMVTGAWARGLMLAAVEVVGIRTLVHGHRVGALMVIATIVTDLFGAMWRLRTAYRPPLPTARLRRH